MRHHFIGVLAIALLATGCDVIDEPDNPVPSVGPCTGNGSGARRVLLEDLTGFRCSTCPPAAEKAREIQSFYCKDVIVVAMHVTSTFAAPLNPAPGPFSTDFRTPSGNETITTAGFQPPNLPIGMVNRKVDGTLGTRLLQHGAWATATAAVIGEPAQFEVLIDTIVHNSVSNTYDFRVRVPVLQDVSGGYNLTVLLTEDHVADWQKDARYDPSDLFPYDHRHVLRDNVNGTWGESIIASSAAVGDTIPTQYSYGLPANVIDPAHCAVVAYVYRTDSYEVMQVSQRELGE